MANAILAAVIHNLDGFMALIADLDTTQRLLDLVRAEIAANGATYVDAAAQLAQARWRLAEALFEAAARRAQPELEEQHPVVLPESEPKPDEEVIAALDQIVADFAELANRLGPELQQQEEDVAAVVARLELEYVDPEVVARTVDYLQTVVRVERIQQQHQVMVQAHAVLVVFRAAAFAVNRAHLLPGVLLTVAVAYALAYAASGGAVVPGSASLLRVSALMLCFLFGVPVVGNLA